MHHYQAMTILKQFVDQKYHRLIQEGEQNPDVLMQKLKMTNKEREKSFNVIPLQVSKEENESLPEIQKSPIVSKLSFMVFKEISNVFVLVIVTSFNNGNFKFKH